MNAPTSDDRFVEIPYVYLCCGKYALTSYLVHYELAVSTADLPCLPNARGYRTANHNEQYQADKYVRAILAADRNSGSRAFGGITAIARSIQLIGKNVLRASFPDGFGTIDGILTVSAIRDKQADVGRGDMPPTLVRLTIVSGTLPNGEPLRHINDLAPVNAIRVIRSR